MNRTLSRQLLIAALILAAVSLVLGGCSSTEEARSSTESTRPSKQSEAAATGAGGKTPKTGTAEISETAEDPLRDAPEWVRNHPGNVDGYYIGIGSSNTGDPGYDRTMAREMALIELSSTISTEIRGEITVSSTDTGQEISEEISITLKERVNQRLEGYEMVDSFSSEKAGYWVYYRLSKARFQQQKHALRDRALAMVSDSAAEVTAADRLTRLSQAWELVFQSPWAGTIEANDNGRKGVLIDILTMEIIALVGSLSIDVQPQPIITQIGTDPEITVSITGTESRPPGRFTIEVVDKENNSTITRITTDPSGRYQGILDVSGYQQGQKKIACRIDTASFGLPEQLQTMVVLPEKTAVVELQQQSIRLVVETENGFDEHSPELNSLYRSVRSLFSETLPYQITDEAETTINVVVHFRDAPKNDYGLAIVYTQAGLTVFNEGRNLYTYETEEIKDGGLDAAQARSRATEKIMEALRDNPTLIEEIEQAVAGKQ